LLDKYHYLLLDPTVYLIFPCQHYWHLLSWTFYMGTETLPKHSSDTLSLGLTRRLSSSLGMNWLIQDKGYIVGSIAACSRCVVACYNVAWRNKSSAGSGNLVPPFAPQRRREGNISNPRVLSDMGLAIPRPTRLGDPRSVCASLSNIILTSLIGVILMAPPSWLLAATP